MVIDGKVAGEIPPAPFKAEHRHTLYSVSKTFAAVAVGLAIEDGLLSVDDELAKFFPEYGKTIKGVKIKSALCVGIFVPYFQVIESRGMINERSYYNERTKQKQDNQIKSK